MRYQHLIAGLLGFAALVPLHAQKTEFEVASVKPADPATRGVRIQIRPGGRFIASNISITMLIAEAYEVKEFQVSGLPGWANSQRFDINAKAAGETKHDELRPMLQALLADRFQMTFHRDTKELPSYSLTSAKSGPKITPGTEGNGPSIQMEGRGNMECTKVGMPMFAGFLSRQLSRQVTDATGLKGDYTFKLTWTPDPGVGEAGRPPEGAPALDTSGPSLFTALQEQLGLKLESKRSPVEIIVVDKLEKPTEN